MRIIEPKTSKDFKLYYDLRWRILRKPWHQEKGTEKDKLEKTSYHIMVCEKDRIPLGVGRIHFNNPQEAQIRYMAVDRQHQKKGIGSIILKTLENYAKEHQAEYIILQSRENVLLFYKKHGFYILKKSHILFKEIQHYKMRKDLWLI